MLAYWRRRQAMRALVVPAVVLAWLCVPKAAAAQDADGYVMEYEDIGGVIVYPDTTQPAQPQPGMYQQEPMYADDSGGPYYYFGPHPDGQGGWDGTEGAHTHDVPPF